jgi:hypothetical protein
MQLLGQTENRTQNYLQNKRITTENEYNHNYTNKKIINAMH